MRIAINGFGRIGRLALRALLDRHPTIKVVGINDLADHSVALHLLRYDSNYGPLNHAVEATDNGLTINGDEIQYLSSREWDTLPWGDLGVDVVIEATGVGTSRDRAEAHLTAGAERVLISAPATDVDLTVVLGVNTNEFDASQHRIVSNASCTTNGLAPPLEVVHREFGIEKGLMTTVHAYTSSQALVDDSRPDLRESRASALSIVPASTGAARAISHVIPDLAGKMHGAAYRVPVPTVSIVEFVAVLAQATNAEAINNALRTSADGRMKGILGVSDEPLVSMDLRGDTRSSIVDSASTMVIGDNLTKVAAWYDNEWAYACRIGDVTALIGSNVDPSTQI